MKKILCKIFGHKWIWMEAMYVGESEGKFCDRCGKEIIDLTL